MRTRTGLTMAVASMLAFATSACDVTEPPTSIDADEADHRRVLDRNAAGPAQRATSVDDCLDGGWQNLGFRNPGECIAAARHEDGRGRDDEIHGDDPPAIVFESDRDGDRELFAISPDGTELRQLTDNSAADRQPAWFPGSAPRLAFVSDRNAGTDIFTLDLRSGTAVQVTDEPGLNFFPDVSPDGSRIAFASTRDGGDYEVYTVQVDGTGLQRLTLVPGADRDPDWSPDGARLAFSSERDGNEEIYVMNADGTAVTRITDHSRQDIRPAWSPGGDSLAFASNRDGNPEIYVLAMTGTGATLTQLTFTSGIINSDPAWSPDGRSIVFTRREPNTSVADLWIVAVDGSGERRLTSDPAADRQADWRWP